MNTNSLVGINGSMNRVMAEIGADARRRRQMEEDNHANTRALLNSSKSLQSLLDGESTFDAIYESVQTLSESAPEDHDTLIAAFGLIVDEVKFQNPHTIVLSGFDDMGNRSSIVAHFSQIVIKIIYLPRRGEEQPREVGFHAL